MVWKHPGTTRVCGEEALEMNLYIGCPIWAYNGWAGSFFPPGTKRDDYLREYARRLTTVEGNTTFYAVPSAKTVREWAAETPDTFRFCPKLSRGISHAGKLVEHIDEAGEFIDTMSLLGERMGPMFLQLPPRYSPNLFEDLRLFLKAWPRGVRLAVEVRHLDWFASPYNEDLNELLSDNDMARVVIDTRPIRDLLGDKILEGSVYQRMLEARQRKPDVPILTERTGPFGFLRYIGHPQFEHNAPFLDEWGETLAGWLQDGAEAYAFCHCPDERLDPWLCRQLYERVAAKLPLPPLPWDDADANTASQMSLF
jgi:uncharacterized protein YecE (DUF72 family)